MDILWLFVVHYMLGLKMIKYKKHLRHEKNRNVERILNLRFFSIPMICYRLPMEVRCDNMFPT